MSSPRPSVSPSDLAAIDIGSNSFRLEIGQITPGRYKRVEYLKETVRLGAGLDTEGMLTEEAAARGLACLARFAQRLAGYAPGQVRAVATQTLREARNRDLFLARAQTVLGYPIEVISGREEARLIYAGVARLQPSEQPRLVIDIGGRSTEMILGCGRTPQRAESFQVGSVSLSLRFFPDGKFTEQAFRNAQIAAGAEFEEALAPFARSLWTEALGSSGTAGAVSQLLQANGITDGAITPDGLRWCIAQCLKAGRADRLALTGLKDDRRAVSAAGSTWPNSVDATKATRWAWAVSTSKRRCSSCTEASRMSLPRAPAWVPSRRSSRSKITPWRSAPRAGCSASMPKCVARV